jgi:hypothetical protein
MFGGTAMQEHLNNGDGSERTNMLREDGEYQEPQGDLEQAVAELWKGLFHLERIGRNDNFFELGGNSLLGMDLSEMFTTHLAMEVPVLTIFQYPTIAEIAQIIASQ